MQTLETMKSKSQASLTHLVEKAKTSSDEVKVWGATAGGALVGAAAVTAAARGILAIVTTLTAPPVAVTVGAVGGGLLAWNYMRKRWADQPPATQVVEEIPVVTAAIREAAPTPDAMSEAVAVDESIVYEAPTATEATQAERMATSAYTSGTPDIDESLVLDPEAALAPSAIPDAAVTQPGESATPDKLEAINGIGPVYAGRLHAAGIQTFAQLAELTPEQIQGIIAPLRSGHMIDPAHWIAEARRLAAHSTA